MTVLTIERVGKFGPLTTDDKWYGLKKPLKPSDFEKGKSYEVELEEWKTGRFNIVNAKLADEKKPGVKKEVEKQQKTKTINDDNKNKRILTQGLVQAVTSSPALASLPFTDKAELLANIKEVSKDLIEFVRTESA